MLSPVAPYVGHQYLIFHTYLKIRRALDTEISSIIRDCLVYRDVRSTDDRTSDGGTHAVGFGIWNATCPGLLPTPNERGNFRLAVQEFIRISPHTGWELSLWFLSLRRAKQTEVSETEDKHIQTYCVIGSCLPPSPLPSEAFCR